MICNECLFLNNDKGDTLTSILNMFYLVIAPLVLGTTCSHILVQRKYNILFFQKAAIFRDRINNMAVNLMLYGNMLFFINSSCEIFANQ